jgi:hypothetical protein
MWIQLFPDQNIHYYLVLLSALFGSLTVQLMFLVFVEITSNRIASFIGSIILMISHSLWWHSTMLEVYTLNTAIIAATLLFIIRYNKTEKINNLFFASFFLGLGCSNHVLMILFIFGFLALVGLLLFKKKCLTLKRILILLGCFLLGFGIFLYAFAHDYGRNLNALKGGAQVSTRTAVTALKETVDDATGSEFKTYMFPKDVTPREKRFWRLNYLIVLVFNYPSAAILLALFGFYCFWKKRNLRMTYLFFIVGLAAQVMWSSNFFIWDMYAFSLPVYLLLSLPIVLGIHFLFTRGRVCRIILLLLLPTFFAPPFIYDVISDEGKREGIVKNYFRQYPEWEQAENAWDVVEYLTNPNKRSYSKVDQYAHRIFEILPQEAHFWNSVGRADYPLRLYYRDIYRVRTDIRHHSLFNPFITDEKAKSEAMKMKTYIDKGMTVYIASLSYPERLVLNQLYLLLDPSGDLDRVRNLPVKSFVDTFPVLKFEEIVLFEEERIVIYRIIPI